MNEQRLLANRTGPASQAEVLVCSKGGGGMLQERMALAALLWEAGIRAELVHEAAPSQTAQYEYAGARGIPWLATIHAATYEATDTVRVRCMPLVSPAHACRSAGSVRSSLLTRCCDLSVGMLRDRDVIVEAPGGVRGSHWHDTGNDVGVCERFSDEPPRLVVSFPVT